MLIILAMILIVVAFLILFSTKWSEDKVITEVKVTGNYFIKEKEIIDIIDDYALKQPKKNIKLDSISKLVTTNNYILQANSSYGINGELKIEVVEREPISFIVDNAGSLQVVDKFSFIFDNFSLPKNLDLPIIYLNSENYNKYSLKNTLEFISSLKKSNLNINDYISYFNLDSDSRIIKAKDKLFNLELIFTRNFDSKLQFNKLTFFLDNYIFSNVNYIDYLDLRWDSKILIGRKI